MSQHILIGKGERPCLLKARYANRHGLVADRQLLRGLLGSLTKSMR